MTHNFSNPEFNGTLEGAIAHVEALPELDNLWLCGMELYGVDSWVAGRTRTLTPAWNSLGRAPQVGELVTIGGGIARWRVLRVAERVGQTFEIRGDDTTLSTRCDRCTHAADAHTHPSGCRLAGCRCEALVRRATTEVK